MSIVSNSIGQLKRLLFTFLGVIRRAFCCRRFFRSSDSILPVTVKPSYPDCPVKEINPIQLASYSNSSGQFSQYSQVNNSWQSWDKQNSSFGNPQLTPSISTFQVANQSQTVLGQHSNSGQNSSSGQSSSSGQHSSQQVQDQEKQEEDYFKDMMPTIKKQKKVLLQTESADPPLPSPDKFSFEPSFGAMATQSQVGASWNEEDVEIEDSLREAREAERSRRLADHQRSKEQRDKKSRSKANLVATRLS